MKVTVYFKERTTTPEGTSKAYTFEDIAVVPDNSGNWFQVQDGETSWAYPREVIEAVKLENT